MYIIIAFKFFSRALVSVNEFSFFLNIIINREKSRKIYPNKSHAFFVCVLSPSVVLWWFSFVTVFFSYTLPSLVALLFIILIIVRRRQDTDGELTIARTPLLCKERPQGRYYGFHCDAEPVYAGWWNQRLCLTFTTARAWLDNKTTHFWRRQLKELMISSLHKDCAL